MYKVFNYNNKFDKRFLNIVITRLELLLNARFYFNTITKCDGG